MVKGEILVNNRPIGPFMHRLSGFIHQDDLFDGTLTVLEHLTFVVSDQKCSHLYVYLLIYPFAGQPKARQTNESSREKCTGAIDFVESEFVGLLQYAYR